MAHRVLRVLNVAEKPSVAREVTRILNNGQQAQQRIVHGCARLRKRAAVAVSPPPLTRRLRPQGQLQPGVQLPVHAARPAV